MKVCWTFYWMYHNIFSIFRSYQSTPDMTAIDMFQLKLEYMIIMYVTYKTIDAVSLYIMFTHVYLILHIYVYTTINKSIMYTDTHVINDSMPDSHK